MKILFLYSEMAGYFINCIQLLHQATNAQVKLICYPSVLSAPFTLDLKGIEVSYKQDYTNTELVNHCVAFHPDLVYVAGWSDKDYLIVCKQLKDKGITIVCGIDNPWKGSLRQRIACLFSKILVKGYFTHLWVAGEKQYQFANRLGFKDESILSGMYAADVEKFHAISEVEQEKELVYVGRFEEIKGIRLLYDTFISLNEEERNGWKLKMIGNGSLKEKLRAVAGIEIYNFMQPDDLIPFVANAGGFILPSQYEPWGVVVQEFAAAGKPLILSDAVNSGEQYLINEYNGYSFQAGNQKQLKATLIQFFNLPDDERKIMGMRSNELAQQGLPKHWAAKLVSLIHNNKSTQN